MVYLPKFEEFRKMVEPTGIKLFQIHHKNNEQIVVTINNERELREYVQYLNLQGVKAIFYQLYIYNPKEYRIDEAWVTKEKYGEFYDCVNSLVESYNRQIPQKANVGFSIVANVGGVMQVAYLRNELYSLLEDPKNVLENIDEYDASLEGLRFYLEERESEKNFMEKRKRQVGEKAKRIPLEQALLDDKIYLSSTTKGARMMRIQELAIKLGVDLNMTKTDLESYSDLLSTKIKLKKKELI